MAFIARVNPARVADIAIGTIHPERLALQMMEQARGPVLQELHTFQSMPAWRALHASTQHGARYEMLTNPYFIDRMVLPPINPRVQVTPYLARTVHGEQGYQHSKLIASLHGGSGRPEALFTNVSLMADSAHRPDVSIRLVNQSATAASEYLHASLGGNPARIGEAADSARRGGLLVNDPSTGRSYLSDAMRAMVDTARHRIVLVSKGLDDADLAARLVQARARGVDVSLSLRDLGVDQAEMLRRGGVSVAMHPTTGMTSRINALVADDLVLTSTAYQWRKMMRPGAPSSRESGVLLAGHDAQRAITALEQTPQGAAALHTLGRPDYARLPAGYQSLDDAFQGQRLVQEVK